MSLHNFITAEFAEHEQVFAATRQSLAQPFVDWAHAAIGCLQAGGTLFWFGNGGSAADAQHLATELTIKYKNPRRALRSIALTTDTSALTACGNDFGFEHIFSRQIEALARKGDMAIGISTSGKSANVLQALQQAKSMGLITVGLTGGTGGQLPPLCDVLLTVPSTTTARIQEMHIMLGQSLIGAIEQEMSL